jgi:hypothetical protein
LRSVGPAVLERETSTFVGDGHCRMRFSTPLLLAAFASAQNPFAFTSPKSVITGIPINITWAPSPGTVDTVTLLLWRGNSTQLSAIATIACTPLPLLQLPNNALTIYKASIQNAGTYQWTPPNTLVAGTGYAFEIVDDRSTFITSFSDQFAVISRTTDSTAPQSMMGSMGGQTGPRTTTTTTTTGLSVTRSVKVGVGLLGVVGAVMTFL